MLFLLKKYLIKDQNNLVYKLVIALLSALVLNVVFGVLFYLAEQHAQPGLTLTDSIWWSMVTMTTVGYGDYYPQTFIGRFVVGYSCFLIGIGLIGYLLGTLADSIINLTNRKKKGLHTIKMKNHIIICHCPNEDKVLSFVEEIYASGQEQKNIVLISNALEECPDKLARKGVQFIKGDPTQEDILLRAGLNTAEGVIIFARNPGDSESDAGTFAIGTIVEMHEQHTNRPIKTVAEVVSPSSRKLFERSNIDGAVIVEGVADKLMVQEFLHPGVHETFEQLLTNTTGCQFYVCSTKLTGNRLVDIQAAALKHPDDLQIIGLNRNGDSMLNPTKKIVLESGDQLIVLAQKRVQYEKFEMDFLEKK